MSPPVRKPPALSSWRRRLIARFALFCAVVQAPAIALLSLSLRHTFQLSTAVCIALTAHLIAWAIPLHRLLYWQDNTRSSLAHVWLFDIPYAAYSTGCFLACIPGYALGLFSLLGFSNFTTVFTPIFFIALAITTWGSTLGRVIATVRTHEVFIDRLHPDLDGLRIVQLSDIHCGPYLPRSVYRHWVSKTLSLKPDLIALTGDFITTGEGYLDDVEDLTKRLSAPLGVWACMGNHDYFQTENGVINALSRAKVKLLRNEGTVLSRGHGSLWLAGIDDLWTHRDDLEKSLANRPEGLTTVLLAHDPKSFTQAAAHGVTLTLSGHTHAGQFGLSAPDSANLGRVLHRYTAGIYRKNNCFLYVHRGLGITAVPTRVGVWPELAVITLRRATSSSP